MKLERKRRSVDELTSLAKDKFPHLTFKSVDDSTRLSKWKCSTHGLFTGKLGYMVYYSKHGCSRCGREEQIKASTSARHLLKESNNKNKRASIKAKHKNIKILDDTHFHCSTCSQDFKSSLHRVESRFTNGCPKCGHSEAHKMACATKSSKSEQLRLHDVKTKLLDYPQLKLLSHSGKMFTVLCKQCGYKTERYSNAILGLPKNVTGCKSCSLQKFWGKRFALELPGYKKDLEVHKHLALLKQGLTISKPVELACLHCNHKFGMPSVKHILQSAKKCPKCYPETWIEKGSRTYSIRKNHDVCLEGISFVVSGYEEQGLRFMIKTMKGLKAKDVINCTGKRLGAAHIPYKLFGVAKNHYPDFWIRKHNLFVEVKSPYTFGMPNLRKGDYETSRGFTIQKAKAKAAISQGYKYRVLVIYKDRVSLLPADWYNQKLEDLGSFIEADLI